MNTTGNLSPERAGYHKWIDKFKHLLWENRLSGGLVYDIGKSKRFDYADKFAEFEYKTIDRDENIKPDITFDVSEWNKCGQLYDTLPKAQGILCNGVVEQCDDLSGLLSGTHSLVDDRGFVLFGMISVGYPLYENDLLRITPNGARFLMQKHGFKIVDMGFEMRRGQVSYIFVIGNKQ